MTRDVPAPDLPDRVMSAQKQRAAYHDKDRYSPSGDAVIKIKDTPGVRIDVDSAPVMTGDVYHHHSEDRDYAKHIQVDDSFPFFIC